MIRRNDFSNPVFGKVYLEKQGGLDAVEKTRTKETVEKNGKPPAQRVLEAKARLEATKAKFKDFTPDEQKLIFEAGKTPFLSSQQAEADKVSDGLRNEFESTPSESLQDFMSRHGVKVELPTQLQKITETTTKKGGFDGLGTAFSMATLTPTYDVAETEHDTSWNPNDKVTAKVDLGSERGGVRTVELGTIGILLAQREGPAGMMESILNKLDAWWAKEHPPLTPQKQSERSTPVLQPDVSQPKARPSRPASGISAPDTTEVVTSQDLAEKGQTNTESTVAPKNS